MSAGDEPKMWQAMAVLGALILFTGAMIATWSSSQPIGAKLWYTGLAFVVIAALLWARDLD